MVQINNRHPRLRNGSGRNCRLRWKIFFLALVLLTVLTIGAMLLLHSAVSRGVMSAEINKLRYSARQLLDMGEEYYMGVMNAETFEAAAKRFHRENKLSFVTLIDAEDNTTGAATSADLKQVVEAVGSPDEDLKTIKLKGRAILVITQKTDTTPPCHLYLGVEKKLIDRKIATAFISGPMMILPLLILLLLIAFLASYFITKPYETLTIKAERLSLGDLNTTFDTESEDEVGSLYGSFDRLRESLNYAIKKLDNRS